jgi:DNA-binding GntR family transcriptional regulator
VQTGAQLVVRQRLMPASDTDPPTLTTVYIPAAVALDAALDDPGLLVEGVLSRVESRGQIVGHDVIERLSARLPSPRDVDLLHVGRNSCLLALHLVVRDRAGLPFLALDLLTPGSPPGIDETFRLR